jgi:hypothetical protein
MAVEMIGLGGAVVSSASTLRKLLCIQPRKGSLMPYRPTLNSHAPFTAVGGYYREEAIMLLRRFYMSENSNGTYALYEGSEADSSQLQFQRKRLQGFSRLIFLLRQHRL